MSGIDFKCLYLLDLVDRAGVPINEDEARMLMGIARRGKSCISQLKVKKMAENSGLHIFNDNEEA